MLRKNTVRRFTQIIRITGFINYSNNRLHAFASQWGHPLRQHAEERRPAQVRLQSAAGDVAAHRVPTADRIVRQGADVNPASGENAHLNNTAHFPRCNCDRTQRKPKRTHNTYLADRSQRSLVLQQQSTHTPSPRIRRPAKSICEPQYELQLLKQRYCKHRAIITECNSHAHITKLSSIYSKCIYDPLERM